jgi:hypothetical protein
MRDDKSLERRLSWETLSERDKREWREYAEADQQWLEEKREDDTALQDRKERNGD